MDFWLWGYLKSCINRGSQQKWCYWKMTFDWQSLPFMATRNTPLQWAWWCISLASYLVVMLMRSMCYNKIKCIVPCYCELFDCVFLRDWHTNLQYDVCAPSFCLYWKQFFSFYIEKIQSPSDHVDSIKKNFCAFFNEFLNFARIYEDTSPFHNYTFFSKTNRIIFWNY